MDEFDDIVLDLLSDWLESHEQGKTIPVEALCEEHPHLIETIRAKINILKMTDWLEKSQDDLDPTSPADFGLPKKLGRYRLRKLLGIGGFGQVWKAFDPVLNRNVAMKIPRKDRFSPQQLKSFLAEAKRIAALNHPGIVPIYDVGKKDDIVFIISEYVKADNLAARLEQGRFSLPEVIEIISQAASVLQHAHESGFVHRDIKPSNILISKDHSLFITDFGIAATIEELEKNTKTAGTLTYMSPEQLSGTQIDHRSDCYSLGLVMLEMLSGSIPPQTVNRDIVLFKQIRSLDAPFYVRKVLKKCLEHSPSRRVDSAQEIIEALNNHTHQKNWMQLAGLLCVVLITSILYSFSQTNESRPTKKFESGITNPIDSQSVDKPSGPVVRDNAVTNPNHANINQTDKTFDPSQVKQVQLPNSDNILFHVTDEWFIIGTERELIFSSRFGDKTVQLEIPDNITCLASSKDRLAIGTQSGIIFIRDLGNHKELFQLKTELNSIFQVDFNDSLDQDKSTLSESTLITVGDNGNAQFWNLKRTPPHRINIIRFVDPVNDIMLSNNGIYIATNEKYWVWDYDPDFGDITEYGFVIIPPSKKHTISPRGYRYLDVNPTGVTTLSMSRFIDNRFSFTLEEKVTITEPSFVKFIDHKKFVYLENNTLTVRDIEKSREHQLNNDLKNVIDIQVHENSIHVLLKSGEILQYRI